MNEKKEFEVKNLLIFFLITFAISYTTWWIVAASSAGLLILDEITQNILSLLGAFGPFIGAFSVAYLSQKKEGIRQLWKKFWNINFKLKWLMITLFLIPLISFISFLIAISIDQVIPELVYLANPLIIIPTYIYYFFIGGPFCEEFGWRGYALNQLQLKWSAFVSSLILGFIWGFWHLPLFYVAGSSQEGQPFFLFVILTMVLSILYTWISNHTNGNVLLAMLFHQAYNFSLYLFPVTSTSFGIFFVGGFLFLIAVAIVIIYKPERLMK